ncbi:MAG: phosphate ABC transporter permease PstA [Clostridiales bacterium]|nr:phosphate ABC transporter permease PstA [Clostridiales bacterium]
MKRSRKETLSQNWNMYKRKPGSLAMFLLIMLSVVITVGVLLALVGYILINGVPNIKPELFAWQFNTDNMSMMPAIISTLYMTILSLAMAVPIGIFSAIHLTEYAKKSSKMVKVIRTTTETLSGIPSIVYGLFGYILFVITLGWSYSILAGAVTLAIMILPLIIRTTEEALMSVPDAYREGSFGLGAGKLYTVFKLILPCAVPGILAGVILAIGRIVGESAALIFTAGTVAQVPDSLFDSARTLSVHMYALLSEGLYTNEAYATAVVLLVMVIGINALSGFIAKRLAAR